MKEAYRVGRPGQQTTNRPRPIIAQLESKHHKVKCLKSSGKLKGTTIFISEDVSKATQDIRDSKFSELKEKRSQGLIAYFPGARLVCRQRPSLGERSAEGRMQPPRNGRDEEEERAEDVNASGNESSTEALENNNTRPTLPAPNPSPKTVPIKTKVTRQTGKAASTRK